MKQPAVVEVGVRPILIGTWVLGLLLAMAPWFSGGREPVALLISSFAVLLSIGLIVRQQQAGVALRHGPFVWGGGVLLSWAALSWLWSANRYSTAIWLITWLLAAGAFYVSYTVSQAAQGRRWLLQAYMWLVAIFCAAGVVMYWTGTYNRLTGPINWPNPAAAFIMPALLVSFWRFWRATQRRELVWNGLAVAWFGAAFWLTGSRAALLVLGLASVLLVIVNQHPKRIWIKLLFSILLPALMSTLITNADRLMPHHAAKGNVNPRLVEVATGNSQSARDRWKYMGSALEMWFDHPVLGTGAGTYGDVHPKYQTTVTSAANDAHNAYIQILAELGLVGAGALALLMLGLLAGMARGLFERPELVPVAVGVGAMLVHLGLDIDGRFPSLVITIAVLVGLVYRPWRRRLSVRRPWVWLGLAVVAAGLAAWLYQADMAAQRGRMAQADDDYATAADYFDQAAASWLANPDWVSAAGINELALAVAASDGIDKHRVDLEQALADARQAQLADPYDAQHWQLEGRVEERLGNNQAAIRAFREALRRDRLNHPEYALDLARVQVTTGDVTAARRTIDDMLSLYTVQVVMNRQDDPSVRQNLAQLETLKGNLALEADDLETAQVASAHALAYDPTNVRVRALAHQVELRWPAKK